MKYLFRIVIFLAVPGLLTFAGCNPFEDDVVPVQIGSQTKLRDDAFTTRQNQAVRLNVLANDSVFTSGSLLFRPPAHGTITSDQAGFVYQPGHNFQGQDQFYYLYNIPGRSDSARISVTVEPF